MKQNLLQMIFVDAYFRPENVPIVYFTCMKLSMASTHNHRQKVNKL